MTNILRKTMFAGVCACMIGMGATTANAANTAREPIIDPYTAALKSIPFIDKLFPNNESLFISPFLNKFKLPFDYKKVMPNESGQILVIMYHGLDKEVESAPYMRTVEGFKSDLRELYDNGYRPITVEDYVTNNITVEAGFSPILLTFDDGIPSAFSLVEDENGSLIPAPDCAVDIMNKFAEEHPDFGKAAVFMINGAGRPAFNGKGTLAQRLQYLVDNGYEIGSHTYSHLMLQKLSAEKLQSELARLEKLVTDCVPGYKMLSVAYPYGSRPREPLRGMILKGESDGVSYDYKIAFRASPVGESTANPNVPGFDALSVPRVRGTDNAATDLGWKLKKYKENPQLRYISDGDPDVISIPSSLAKNINPESLAGKVLNIYDAQK